MIEKTVEKKACKRCGISFTITDKDREFYDKISPVFAGKKYQVPSPTFCPDCRQQRRLSRRNERKLYRRNCDASGKQIISIFSPEKPYKVYDQKIWRSDSRNPMDYGQDYDFSKSFFNQFERLNIKIPKMSLSNTGSENSEYVNYSRSLKNCYLCFGLGQSEKCCYIQTGRDLIDCFDCSYVTGCQNCYELLDSHGCFNVLYSQCCASSNNSSHCYDIEGCSFCTLCVGLVNKTYCILNEQYDKDSYFKKLEEVHKNRDEYKQKFRALYLKIPRKFGQFIQTENCTGNVLLWSKNAKCCFDSIKLEDSKYSSAGLAKHIYDGTSINAGTEFMYEAQGAGGYKSLCISDSIGVSESFYCNQCFDSTYLFGCVGIKNKKYCILNKQYTKEEYETLVPKIIQDMEKNGEWGEFFPTKISQFGYNETVAQEYFPYTKEEALMEGYKRMDQEYPINIPENAQTIKAQDLPENISDVVDDILNQVIVCEVTRKPFRIIKAELEFYRKHDLPIPHKHPDQRHVERMQLRNPRKLRDRTCPKCGVDIQTTYSPERPEIVYCGDCYNKEMYG